MQTSHDNLSFPDFPNGMVDTTITSLPLSTHCNFHHSSSPVLKVRERPEYQRFIQVPCPDAMIMQLHQKNEMHDRAPHPLLSLRFNFHSYSLPSSPDMQIQFPFLSFPLLSCNPNVFVIVTHRLKESLRPRNAVLKSSFVSLLPSFLPSFLAFSCSLV